MTRKRTSENDMVASGAVASSPSRRKSGSRTRAKYTPPTGETPTQSSATVPTAIPTEIDIQPVPAPVAAAEPAREQIAELAYLYWEARGCQGGCPEEDWLRAEQELRSRQSAVATA